LPTIDLELLPEEGVPDPTPNPEKMVAISEEERGLRKLLVELNPQDRAALIMRYWYDFSDQEIAQSLSLTVSAVKSRLHRARQLLAVRWQAVQPNYFLKEETA